MKFLCVSILMLTFCAKTAPQELKHAPTFQSCTADLNLWTAQIPGWPNPSAEQARGGTKALTFNEMGKRIASLGDCVNTYPALSRARAGGLSMPFSLMNIYHSETAQRYFDFIDRHNLLGKFMQEDEAGKR